MSPTTTSPAITFRAPGLVPYSGGCITEPAFFALDCLVHYRSDMQVGEKMLHEVNVLETLRAVLADPATHGLSRTDAEAARERFLEQAGQALVAQVAWLEKEFDC